MYNSKTKRTILVGTSCCKKFNFKEDAINNKLLKRILKAFVKTHAYEIIVNAFDYSDAITNKLIDLVKSRFEECKDIPADRQELLNDIDNLIKEYYMTELSDTFKEIKKECRMLDNADTMNKLMEEEILEYRKQITERSRNSEEPKEEKKPSKFKRRYYTCYTYGAPIESVGRRREI
jgi:hypothetical protein